MNPKVINPYSTLAEKHTECLEFIIAMLPPNPTFDDLNAKLVEFFFTPNPANPSMFDSAGELLKFVLPNAYNGYVNGGAVSYKPQAASGYWRYSESQMGVIRQMLNGINNIPAESIGEFLSRVEEDIVSGSLTYSEQAPLLLAVVIGKSDSEYWLSQIATPAGWAVYLNPDNAINNMRVAGWVSASMQGALLGYGLMTKPELQMIDFLTAEIGSVGLVAGKVIWGWLGNR